MEAVFSPPCPYYKKCGGCQLQKLPYEEQLRRKNGRCIALLGEFCHVEPILGMEASTSPGATPASRWRTASSRTRPATP